MKIKTKFFTNASAVLILITIFLTYFQIDYFIFDENLTQVKEIVTCDSKLIKFSEIKNIEYIDISIFSEYKNLYCLGKPYQYNFESKTLLIGFSSKIINLFLIVINFIFFIYLYFSKKLSDYAENILLFFITFISIFTTYQLFTKTNMGVFTSLGDHPFEVKLDFFIFYLFLIYKKFNNKLLLLQILSVSMFFKPSLLGPGIIILLIRANYIFTLDRKYKTILLGLPIIKFLVLLISVILEKFNIIWLSLIQDPYSGLSRSYDMWLTLTPLKCQLKENYQVVFKYSDYLMTCPQDFYNPIYKYFSLTLDVWVTIKVLNIIFILLFIAFYLYLLKIFSNNQEIVSLFFLMPPLNFLLYTGNFDILTLFLVFISLKLYKKNYYFSLVILLFASLMEIHPISVLLSLLFISIINFDIKKIFSEVVATSIFFYFILNHQSSVSIQNQFLSKNSFGFGFEYVGNQGAGIGIMLDLSRIFNLQPFLNFVISVIIFTFILILSFYSKKMKFRSSLNFDTKNYLTKEEKVGYIGWYLFSLIFANQAYRLSNFLIFFLVIFITNKKHFKLAILLTCFLIPTTLIYGRLFYFLQIFLNRVGLYYIFVILIIELTNIIFDNEKVTKI